MKILIAFLITLLATQAFALEPGHYTRRCDDTTIVQYYKGDTTEKEGEAYGTLGRIILDLVVSKDGDFTVTRQTGMMYFAADHDTGQPYPEFTSRTKTTRGRQIETVMNYEKPDADGKVATFANVYWVEEDNSRTLLRTIRNGVSTEAKGLHTLVVTNDGNEITVDITSGLKGTDPEGRHWEDVKQKDICVTSPVK